MSPECAVGSGCPGSRSTSGSGATRSTATSSAVVAKILYLRQHYHFGPARIAAYLHRFHAIAIAGSSVHRILKRRGIPLT